MLIIFISLILIIDDIHLIYIFKDFLSILYIYNLLYRKSVDSAIISYVKIKFLGWKLTLKIKIRKIYESKITVVMDNFMSFSSNNLWP